MAVAAGCYYALIIILFYTKDIAARLKGGSAPLEPSSPGKPSPSDYNLMGPIQNSIVRPRQIKQTSLAADEVEVAENVNPITDERDLTPADELIQELCCLFQIMKEGDPSQEAYLKNIKTLLSQYPQMLGSDDHKRVTRTIIQELQEKHDILLSTEVVEQLWPKETLNQTSHS